MAMRAEPAVWFELLTTKGDLSAAMQALAATRSVHLDTRGEPAPGKLVPELHEALSEYGELQRRYGAHWPEAKLTERRDTAPAALLRTALNTLKAWGEASEDLVRDIERKESERARLLRLRGLLEAGHQGLPKLSQLASTGPVLAAVAYELPRDQWPESLPASVVTRRIATPHSGYVIAVGLAEDIAALRSDLETLKGREVPLPDWLPDDPVDAQRRLDHRLNDIAESLAALESKLEANTAAFGVEHALGDLELLRWLAGHLGDVPSTPHFAWIVGWTSDSNGEVLQRALRGAGVRFLLRCPATPAPGREAPMLFRNPQWAKPFELFARLLGTPGANEADPSRLVAILAPLLFGFMFGDVGHGLVLLVAGLVLRRRYPATSILVPGGLVSILFGFAFGSVFAIEGLIPALWLHPLQEPLTLLWVSLLIGGVVITLGLILGAMSALWLGQFGGWLATGAGLLVAYLSAWGAFFRPSALWLVPVGLAWSVLGHLFVAPQEQRLTQVKDALIELPENVLQLLVNTVSFVRVGAFALAHSGLSTAVVEVAAVFESFPAQSLVLILGNLVVIVLEGLVVAVQTTRLVLFEFFIRFLRGEGRPFHPLPPPNLASNNDPRSVS